MNKVFLRALLLLLAICAGSLAWAQEGPAPWQWAPAQPVGAVLPDLALTGHEGQAVTLGEVGGERGTLLIFSRSTDW